jgi:hypothetical protein
MALGGTMGAAGSVCDATGHCVAPPGTPGGCCEEPDQGTCFEPVAYEFCPGIYHDAAVCLPTGTCSP